MNDFYVILPSNAMYDDTNCANHYTTACNQEIDLSTDDPHSEWRVGLTEVSYYRENITISKNSGFLFDYNSDKEVKIGNFYEVANVNAHKDLDTLEIGPFFLKFFKNIAHNEVLITRRPDGSEHVHMYEIVFISNEEEREEIEGEEKKKGRYKSENPIVFKHRIFTTLSKHDDGRLLWDVKHEWLTPSGDQYALYSQSEIDSNICDGNVDEVQIDLTRRLRRVFTHLPWYRCVPIINFSTIIEKDSNRVNKVLKNRIYVTSFKIREVILVHERIETRFLEHVKCTSIDELLNAIQNLDNMSIISSSHGNAVWRINNPSKTNTLLKDIVRKMVANFSYNVDSKCIQFTNNSDVKLNKLLFNGDLHFVLGFPEKTSFNKQLMEHYQKDDGASKSPLLILAQFPPHLTRGIASMYIYSNICGNTRVGDVFAPLLRNVSLPTPLSSEAKDIYMGRLEVVSIDKPMYVPVSTKTINSIEIEIRTNTGDHFPFIEGSVTTLTLHFKQIK